MLSSNQEMKIMNILKGQTIKQVEYKLEVMRLYVAKQQLKLRCKVVGLTIGSE